MVVEGVREHLGGLQLAESVLQPLSQSAPRDVDMQRFEPVNRAPFANSTRLHTRRSIALSRAIYPVSGIVMYQNKLLGSTLTGHYSDFRFHSEGGPSDFSRSARYKRNSKAASVKV